MSISSSSKVIKGMVYVIICLCAVMTQAANVRVTNVTTVPGAPAGESYVQFDISWDASWRADWTETGVTPNVTVTNWDAAWIFVKYKEYGATSWSHATLSTNVSDHVVPAGTTISVGTTGTTSAAGVGVYLYRSASGAGSWTNTAVKLRWKWNADLTPDKARADVCVHAIEMVYVPQGAYDLGDGNGAESRCALHVTDNTKVRIVDGLVSNIKADVDARDDDQLELTGIGISGLGGIDTNNDTTIDNADFPTGYKAFYCMKYKISQGQYAAFLNQLPSAYVASLYDSARYNTYRYTITGTYPNLAADAPDRACNFLKWADNLAYFDWAGLRPMSELEYEKACRGPLPAVKDERAWGTTVNDAITAFTGTDGSGTETPSSATANVNGWGIFPGSTNGPARCGIFARADSTRVTAGATYWGILDMTGTPGERVVTVGKADGRAFTGLPGDGKLASAANNVVGWPGTRGGDITRGNPDGNGSFWALSARYHYVGDESVATFRSNLSGGRGVRSAQ